MKRQDDIDWFLKYGILIPDRVIFLGGGYEAAETDYEMVETAIKGLTLLDRQTGDITIKMNNFGGDEYHGLAIYDVIRLCKNHVTMEVHGSAMSMGSWILQAADKRLMAPHATMMLHYGTWGKTDDWKNAEVFMGEGKRLNALMCQHYLERIRVKHPSYSENKLSKLLERDKYLTAVEAVEMGLADEIMQYPTEKD